MTKQEQLDYMLAELRQLPAWLAVIGLGCAVVALAAVIGRGVA